jgi:hypothetical protein
MGMGLVLMLTGGRTSVYECEIATRIVSQPGLGYTRGNTADDILALLTGPSHRPPQAVHRLCQAQGRATAEFSSEFQVRLRRGHWHSGLNAEHLVIASGYGRPYRSYLQRTSYVGVASVFRIPLIQGASTDLWDIQRNSSRISSIDGGRGYNIG